MIPKIIHYCWFGGNELSKDAKRYIEIPFVTSDTPVVNLTGIVFADRNEFYYDNRRTRNVFNYV